MANPDLTPLQPLIDQGDKMFAAAVISTMNQMAARHVPRSEADAVLAPLWQKRDQAIAGIAARYVSHPWAVNFRLIVSPLVTWLWLGALIMAVGGLIALWPAAGPGAPPRPARPDGATGARAPRARRVGSPVPAGARRWPCASGSSARPAH